MLLDQVVVGSCVPALLKSHVEKIPILIDSMAPPSEHSLLPYTLRVEDLVTDNPSDVWSMLKFLLSMDGLVINNKDLEYVRVEQEGISSRHIDLQFKKCHLFPSKKTKTNLEIKTIQNKDLYRVSDFMRLKTGSVTNISSIYPKDVFIESIELFDVKNIVSLSTLTKEQLTDFNYSDTIVRFMSQKELSSNENIHRPPIRKDSELRRNIKLEVIRREVESLEENVYKSSKRIKYYDRKKRNDILETYCRYNSSLQS